MRLIASVEVYDMGQESACWQTVSEEAFAPRIRPSLFVSQHPERIFIAGGATFGGKKLSDIYAYDLRSKDVIKIMHAPFKFKAGAG